MLMDYGNAYLVLVQFLEIISRHVWEVELLSFVVVSSISDDTD